MEQHNCQLLLVCDECLRTGVGQAQRFTQCEIERNILCFATTLKNKVYIEFHSSRGKSVDSVPLLFTHIDHCTFRIMSCDTNARTNRERGSESLIDLPSNANDIELEPVLKSIQNPHSCNKAIHKIPRIIIH